MRKVDSNLASVLVRQLLDNTMLAAGLISDPKNFITRVTKLMSHILNNPTGGKFDDSQFRVEAERGSANTEEFSEEKINSILNELKKEKENEEKGKGKEDKNKFDAEIVIDKDGNPQVKK